MSQNNILISRFSVACVFIFATFLLVSRFILPMGDEPDWDYRISRIINNRYFFTVVKDNINQILINSNNCFYENSIFDFIYTSQVYCISNCLQTFFRFFLAIVPLTPLLIILIFRNSLFLSKKSFFSTEQNSRRLDAVSLTLIYPSFIYYIGLVSEEQLFLCITIYIFLFKDLKIFTIFFYIALYYIDTGNFIVYVGGLLFLEAVKFTYKCLGHWCAFLWPTIFLIVSYFESYELLKIFIIFDDTYLIDIFRRAQDIYSVLNLGAYSSDVPLLLRILVTVSSAVLMTASGIKGILGYPIFVIGIIYIIFRFKKLKLFHSKDFLLHIYSPIAFIFSVVLLIPTHANFKYYAFLLPNIFYGFLAFFDKKSIYSFNILLLISSFSIFFYYFLILGNYYG